MPRLGYALLFLIAPLIHAAPVSLPVQPNILARADYRPGAAEKPAILLLHGFLQTQDFRTIQRLADGLHDEGFTVLSPTLSLGIPMRQQSLACEAIHTHTLADDKHEIDVWLDWLKVQGHPSVVLIGHSTGSIMLLAYLQDHPRPEVQKLIAISLAEGKWELDDAHRYQLLASLRNSVANGANPLLKHQFSFCKSLHATARCLLSYLQWTPDRILSSIQDLRVDEVFILGSRDERLEAQWLEDLRRAGKPMHMIAGADHFMDGEFEFELLEQVLAELQ